MNKVSLTTEFTESIEVVKELNQLTELVIGCAIEVHRTLGPGFLESTYEICLCHELIVRRRVLGLVDEITL